MGFKKLLLCSWIVLFSICVATGCGEAEIAVESTITEDVSISQTDMVSDITDEPIVDDAIEEKTEVSMPENDFVTLSTGVVVDANNLTPEDVLEIGKSIIPPANESNEFEKEPFMLLYSPDSEENTSFAAYGGYECTNNIENNSLTLSKDDVSIILYFDEQELWINGELYTCSELDPGILGSVDIYVYSDFFFSSLLDYSLKYDCRFIWENDLSATGNSEHPTNRYYPFNWDVLYVDPLTKEIQGGSKLSLALLEKWLPYITEINRYDERTSIIVQTEDTSAIILLWRESIASKTPEGETEYIEGDYVSFEIERLDTTSPDFYTSRFIRVGDSKEDATKAYGIANDQDVAPWFATYDGNQTVQLFEENGVVSRIVY